MPLDQFAILNRERQGNMKANEILLVFFAAILGGVCGFLASQNLQRQTYAKCVVTRVIDDATDEPPANGDTTLPLTILHYQPAWETFTLPGVVGEPGQEIWTTPPSRR